MDAAHDLETWLRIAHARPGAQALERLLERFGDAPGVCRAPRAALREAGIGDAAAAILCAGSPAIERELAWREHPGREILSRADPRYPRLLAELPAPPAVLYAAGDVDVLDTLMLAMVGSRRPTAAGERTAYEFARHLAGRGLTICSGLALGIDAAGHRGALDADGFTVAVAGTGLARVYPESHAQLSAEIAERGLLLSEFTLDTPPRRENFPRRNRLISGLSAGVLVVEAALRSGSLITARLAAEQGREVFAVPGSIHNPLARGTNSLIRSGAKLVETAAHILEELAPHIADVPIRQPAPEAPQAALDAEYRTLLEAMDFAPASVDALVTRTGLGPAEVASMLLILELRGLVESGAGGVYLRTATGAPP